MDMKMSPKFVCSTTSPANNATAISTVRRRVPGGCFTSVSRALQNILLICVYRRNSTCGENFKLKFCTCAQSYALGTRTYFQLEMLTINMISGVVYFREIILESSRNVSETTHRSPSHPFMAASPDGLTSCTWCGEGALEIKIHGSTDDFQFLSLWKLLIHILLLTAAFRSTSCFPGCKSFQVESWNETFLLALLPTLTTTTIACTMPAALHWSQLPRPCHQGTAYKWFHVSCSHP